MRNFRLSEFIHVFILHYGIPKNAINCTQVSDSQELEVLLFLGTLAKYANQTTQSKYVKVTCHGDRRSLFAT